MEFRKTTAAERQSGFDTAAARRRDNELARQKLDALSAVNAEVFREKFLYRSECEKAAATMKNPFDCVKTFSRFGLILGTFPPAAMFTRYFIDSGGLRVEDLWIIGILAIVNTLSAIVGFFSGKLIGRTIRQVETYSWSKMLLLLPLIGMFWGIAAGAAGGIIILIFGAFFGAILGGITGSVALPAFTILHRLLKTGDLIDRSHFLPLAFGVAFIICGFILGL